MLYCAACRHPLANHFRAEDGRVYCLHRQSGVSTSGVIGMPWTDECDCVDHHSKRGDCRRGREAAERAEESERQEEFQAGLDEFLSKKMGENHALPQRP